MTKQEFKDWLQDQFNQADTVAENRGDEWRTIEDEELLDEIGVEAVCDHVGHDFIFKCSDGFLASNYETGLEDETIWFFAEGQVENNMRDYTLKDVDHAIGKARFALSELEGLLP